METFQFISGWPKKREFLNRCSKSEVIRKLVEIGLKAESKKQKKSTTNEQAG